MKYQELIDRLLPFAEEEVNLTVWSYNAGGKNVTDDVRFFSASGEHEFIVGARQRYNSCTLENVGESEVYEIEIEYDGYRGLREF